METGPAVTRVPPRRQDPAPSLRSCGAGEEGIRSLGLVGLEIGGSREGDEPAIWEWGLGGEAELRGGFDF